MGVFVVVYVITLLSVHKPAKLAAAVSPMEALRYQPQDGMKAAAGRKLCRNLTPVGLGAVSYTHLEGADPFLLLLLVLVVGKLLL